MNNSAKKYKSYYTNIILMILYLLFVGKFVVAKTGIMHPQVINIFIMILSVFIMFSFKSYFSFLFKYILLMLLYFTFKALIYDIDYIYMIKMFYSTYVGFFFCVIIYEFCHTGRANTDKIRQHFYYIFALQCLLALGQYFIEGIFDFFCIHSLTWKGQTVDPQIPDGVLSEEVGHVLGTSLIQSIFANIIAIFTMISICDVLYNPVKYVKTKCILIIMGFLVCFLSGIRTPFLMLLLMSGYMLFKKGQKLFLYYLVGVSLVAINFLTINLIDDTSSIARMQKGFSILLSGDFDSMSGITFFYSLFMFPYFLSDPLFGISLGDRYIVGNLPDGITTDIMMMYYLCEFGLIGCIILVWPIARFGKIAKCERLFNYAKPIFVLSLLLTIVDDTFVNFLEAKYLYALCFALFANIKTLK